MEVINWEKCLEILVVTIMEANGDTTITIGNEHVLRKNRTSLHFTLKQAAKYYWLFEPFQIQNNLNLGSSVLKSLNRLIIDLP